MHSDQARSNEDEMRRNDERTLRNVAQLTRDVEINIIARYAAAGVRLADISAAVLGLHLYQLQVIVPDSRGDRQGLSLAAPVNRRAFAHLAT